MSTIARLTIEDYDRLVNTGVFDGKNRRRIELNRGELRDMSPIGPDHETAVDYLNEWSMTSVPLDAVLVRIQNSVGLPRLESVPEPDIAWVRRKSYRAGRPKAKDVLLLIEVSYSSLADDRGEKAELYALEGIKDYWIVNLIDRAVEVHRDPHRGKYRSLQTFVMGEEVSPLSFPKIRLKVSALFK